MKPLAVEGSWEPTRPVDWDFMGMVFVDETSEAPKFLSLGGVKYEKTDMRDYPGEKAVGRGEVNISARKVLIDQSLKPEKGGEEDSSGNTAV